MEKKSETALPSGMPEAYQDIDGVIAALLEAGLCRVVAVLRPVITYKTRRR